jgi:hypothetical protein
MPPCSSRLMRTDDARREVRKGRTRILYSMESAAETAVRQGWKSVTKCGAGARLETVGARP